MRCIFPRAIFRSAQNASAMNVEVINTGTELLLGNVMNLHLAFFGRELFALGLRVHRQVTVPDGEPIRETVAESFGRAEIVLLTGGLGPTTDDITRDVVADLLGLEMDLDPDVVRAIEARFARRGLTMNERVKRQAQVPRGATVLPNANGTAPGLYLPPIQLSNRALTNISAFRPLASASNPQPSTLNPQLPSLSPHLFLLPGPPRELRPMFIDSVFPILKKIAPGADAFSCRTYRLAGTTESQVEEAVGEEILAIPGIELGYCARPGEVEVRCIGPRELLDRADEIVFRKLKPHIVSTNGRPIEQVVVETLIARGAKLAVAESCTGGLLANRITNVSGSSNTFVAGFVTYANEAKTRDIGVDARLIAEHGAVSREVATAMAEGALRAADADYALSTTGIAGPTGGTPEKPVGTVYIGLAARGAPTRVEHHVFPTDRETFKYLVTQAALDLLRRNC
jgi:PncC family amidohydrolase